MQKKNKIKNIYSGGMFYEKSCHVIIKCVKDNMKSKTDRKLLWKLNTLWCSFMLSLRIYNLGRYIYPDNFVLYIAEGII